MNQTSVENKKDKRLLVLLILGGLIMVPHFVQIFETADQPVKEDMFLWLVAGKNGGQGNLHVVPGCWQQEDFVAWYGNKVGRKNGDSVWALLRERGAASVGPDGVNNIENGADPSLLLLLGLPIPINRADAQTIALVPGIGPVLSERIVDFRSLHSKILDPHKLLKVQGIGPSLLAKIKLYFSFE
ncbi:MAG: helix-hairpin-helix domain-containing protein [Desulfobulbaceae bacterium]|nr:helix-hairpin-helix domain-containing protein [Desulfobulbaceae bacterium]